MQVGIRVLPAVVLVESWVYFSKQFSILIEIELGDIFHIIGLEFPGQSQIVQAIILHIYGTIHINGLVIFDFHKPWN